METVAALALIAGGYVLGSIPSGYLAGRLHGIDIRRVGDGNIGMMNVWRQVGPGWGFLVFVADVAKAALAVQLGRVGDFGDTVPMAAGAAALVGHRYPFTLGFRGGRSAASACGAVLGLIPLEGIGPLVLGIAIVVVTRNAIAALGIGFATMLGILVARGADPATIAYVIAVPVYAGVNDALDRSRRRPLPSDT